MDVKMTCLNGDLYEDVYIDQLDGFVESGKNIMSTNWENPSMAWNKQWYLKFDHIISSLGFKENAIDQCIYFKNSGCKFVILVLYVDDIILASNDVEFLHGAK